MVVQQQNPDRYGFHLFTQGHKETQYNPDIAKSIAMTMNHFNNMRMTNNTKSQYAFVVTYSLKKGLKHFGPKGYDAAFSEVKQLHDRIVFRPVNINKLTPLEKKRALESLRFLVEKRNGTVKGRYCTNGSNDAV
jgi:hypothetical protein